MAVLNRQEQPPVKLLLITSPPPHVHAAISVDKMVQVTMLALVPAVCWTVYLFGWNALRLVVVSMAAAVGTEALIRKLRNKPATLRDGTAVLTGLILAMTLPPTFPSWMAAVGAVAAIGLGKQAFGGVGFNPFNPAIVGKVFLTGAFFSHVTAWVTPSPWMAPFGSNPTTSPLELWRAGEALPGYGEMLMGYTGGTLGELSNYALLLGGLLLVAKGYVDWRAPLGFMGSVAVLMLLVGQDPLWHVLAGGVILGAFFLAVDPVTTPVTRQGRLAFGIGAGLCLVVIRLWGGYPEGMAYAILLMNGLTPLINRYLRPKKREVKTRA
ncbi:hypothetical protein SY88_18020 [Clostridiales bacterium PH28_bin88]|nr:hypothetical protein SY88_18020 [Clostridiales bacterium PH28_bin88]